MCVCVCKYHNVDSKLYRAAALKDLNNDTAIRGKIRQKILKLNTIVCYIYMYIQFMPFNLIYITIYNYLNDY
jgi:hypothetical protein